MGSRGLGMAVAEAPPQKVELIRAELARVESLLADSAVSSVEILQEAALHILSSGGKRLRPQLVLLVSQLLAGDPERAVPVAAACELVHTATLVHDDIVDESDSRRGKRAVRFFFGNSAAVLMGDYLVVQAFKLLARDPDRRLWPLLADVIAQMCEGEVLQIAVRGDTSIPLPTYELIISSKTARLMSLCCRFGALVAGADGVRAQAAADFGYHLGMAFQVQDDVLDYLGVEPELGKPVGTDLRERKVTLPVLLALRDSPLVVREELAAYFSGSESLRAGDVGRVVELIQAAGGFAKARAHAQEHLAFAERAIGLLPTGPARVTLEALADSAVNRTR